jgi:hypothetical protein
VQHLSQRLESLEKRLITGQQSLPVSPSQTPVDDTASPVITVPTHASPNVALMEENGQECESLQATSLRHSKSTNPRSMDLSHGDRCEKRISEGQRTDSSAY